MRAALASRLPFSYGWVLAVVAGGAGAFVSGMTSWGLGVFVTPMQEEFGWSRSLFFLPLAVGALASIGGGPIFGPSMDKRHGPQVWFLIGVLLFGTSLISMKYVDGFFYYLLVYGVLGGMGHFGLFGIRAVIPKWFIRKRGRALAVVGGMTSLGPLTFPPALQIMVGSIGWRDTWMAVGLLFLALMIPASALVVRAPEDIGLHPDGDRETWRPDVTSTRPSAADEVSYTRSEAVRTVQFWMLIAAVTVGTVSIRGMIPNILPYFVDQGLHPTTASFSFSAYAVTTIIVAFVWGAIADRKGARGPFIGLTVVMGTSTALLWTVDTTPVMFAAMVYLGVGINAYLIMGGLYVANLYGRAHYGGIFGLVQPFNNAATYGGPLAFGVLYDLTNDSYGALFLFAVALWVVTFTAAYLVRPLPRPLVQTADAG